jgi:hypothetical protein
MEEVVDGMLEEYDEEGCEEYGGDHSGGEVEEGNCMEEEMYYVKRDELEFDGFEKVVSGGKGKLSVGF